MIQVSMIRKNTNKRFYKYKLPETKRTIHPKDKNSESLTTKSKMTGCF